MKGRLAAYIAATALVGVAVASTPAATSKPPWRVLPGVKQGSSYPLLAVGWASDRVWIVTVHRDPVLTSARVSGRAFTSLVETRVPTEISHLPIVDGQLVFPTGSGQSRTTVTAPLLASGRLGTPKAVEDDLLARTREQSPRLAGVGIVDGVRTGDRTVWALGAGGTDRKFYLLVCCSESGAASDVIARQSVQPEFVQLGLDARGRIWLAWLDTTGYDAVRGVPRLAELDPTLAARSKALAPPALVADKIELACATSCRLVAQSAAGDIVSWGPGERSPTRIASHYTWPKGAAQPNQYPAFLLAASYRSGRLAVAYQQVSRGRAGRDEIRVVRGDARGVRSRVVGATIAAPFGWPPGKQSIYYPVTDAAFVPGGLVAIATFKQVGAYSPVIGAFVPLSR